MSKRLGGIIGCKDKNLFMAFKRVLVSNNLLNEKLWFLTFSVMYAKPPEKVLTLHGGQSRWWSAEQGKENKRESLAAHRPSPPPPHAARSEKIK